jgi:hypothetical protein
VAHFAADSLHSLSAFDGLASFRGAPLISGQALTPCSGEGSCGGAGGKQRPPGGSAANSRVRLWCGACRDERSKPAGANCKRRNTTAFGSSPREGGRCVHSGPRRACAGVGVKRSCAPTLPRAVGECEGGRCTTVRGGHKCLSWPAISRSVSCEGGVRGNDAFCYHEEPDARGASSCAAGDGGLTT